MPTTAFDTLKYSKRLQELGFSREQAEGFAEIQQEIMDERLATKADLRSLKNEMQVEMREMEYRLTIRLGAMLAAGIGLPAALITLA